MAYSVSYTYRILDQYTAPLKKISAQTDRFRGVAARAGAAAKGMASKMSGLQNVAASAASVIGGAALVNRFASYEAVMNTTAAITQATTEDFDTLKKAALEMSAKSVFSSREVASGMEMLARNGLKLRDVIAGMPSVLSLSAATGAQLAVSADFATDVMVNFGKKTKDLPKIVDLITGATVNSKMSIDKLVYAFQNVAQQAGKLTKLTLPDTVTAIAAIAPAFVSGERAGTAFRTFLRMLDPTTERQKKTMRRLGLYTKQTGSVFIQAEGKLRPMVEIIERLRSATVNLTDAQKSQALEAMFGVEGMNAAAVIASMTTKQFKSLGSAIESVSAKKLAETRLAGLYGALKLVGSVLDNINVMIFESGIAEVMQGWLMAFKGFLERLRDSSPALLKFIGWLGVAAVTIGPLIAGLSLLTVAMGPFLGMLGAIGGVVAGITAPVWVVVGAFAALGTTIAVIIAKWDKITSALKGFASYFKVDTTALEIGEGGLPGPTGGPGVAAQNEKVKAAMVVQHMAEANVNNRLDGKIKIEAPKGVVKMAEIETTAPGDMGFNLAGAF